MLENLLVPTISSPHDIVLMWNLDKKAHLDVMFKFAMTQMHDNGAMVLVHADDPITRPEIISYDKMNDFTTYKEWKGINKLHQQASSSNRALKVHNFWGEYDNFVTTLLQW